MEVDVDSIDWQKSDGLVPAIAQHADTGQVLMLGYMNREALEETRRRGRVVFYSRSRQRLWEKGETSGNTLKLESIVVDCDRDTLLLTVHPAGPVCHTGSASCFGDLDPPRLGFLCELQTIIDQRLAAGGDSSYTATLAARGVRRVAQKVGEEGLEVALAGAGEPDEQLCSEAADLLFHLLLLLRVRGLDLADVTRELASRHQARAAG